MHYKIGVYGSTTKGSKEAVNLAEELGTQLARNQVIVITGACSGMPYVVASAAKRDSKPIGVLRRTGGLADELPHWFYRLPQKSESRVILSDNPSQLVSLLLRELQQLTD